MVIYTILLLSLTFSRWILNRFTTQTCGISGSKTNSQIHQYIVKFKTLQRLNHMSWTPGSKTHFSSVFRVIQKLLTKPDYLANYKIRTYAACSTTLFSLKNRRFHKKQRKWESEDLSNISIRQVFITRAAGAEETSIGKSLRLIFLGKQSNRCGFDTERGKSIQFWHLQIGHRSVANHWRKWI